MGNQNNNSTAEKLRACRKKCRLSQQQVADALGKERSAYTYYESGRTMPKLKDLVKLSQIFCVDLAELLPNENIAQLRDSEADSPNPIFSLTNDEQSLLISYRLLSDKEKKRILAKITNMSKDDK